MLKAVREEGRDMNISEQKKWQKVVINWACEIKEQKEISDGCIPASGA